jgi:hypothetical protein
MTGCLSLKKYVRGCVSLKKQKSQGKVPPSPVRKLDRQHTGRLRKRDNLLGSGWVRSPYDPKKSGPSINHSILSATGCQRDGASSRSSQYSGAQRRRVQAQVGAQAALVPVSQNVVFAL